MPPPVLSSDPARGGERGDRAARSSARASSRRPAIGRRAVAVLLGAVLGLVLGEIGLRVLLFSRAPVARSLGARWREPELYAPPGTDDYWKLQHLFQDERIRGASAPGTDALLGWTGPVAGPPPRLAVEPPADGRRLVLLYGDSYSQCDTPAGECFPALLEGSDLGGRFVLGNFGVGGYGLDQMLLLVRSSIEGLQPRDPIVIVAILAEDDLDRCLLSFRGWPKPRFRLKGGELELEGPVETDVARYLERHPLSFRSYAARLVRLRFGLLPREALPTPPEESAALARAILLAIDRELDQRGLEHFFYLFHGVGALAPDASRWQEELVRDVCREAQVPLLSSRPYLLAACGDDPARAARFYGPTGHLNPTGNQVAFEGLRQGLLGRFDGEDTARVRARFAAGEFEGDLVPEYPRRLLGLDAHLRAEEPDRQALCFASSSGGAPWFLSLRPGASTPLRITWSLPPGARRFAASARAVLLPDATAPPPLELELRAGARPAERRSFACDGDAGLIELDLSGAAELVLELAPAGGDAFGARLLLQKVVVE